MSSNPSIGLAFRAKRLKLWDALIKEYGPMSWPKDRKPRDYSKYVSPRKNKDKNKWPNNV